METLTGLIAEHAELKKALLKEAMAYLVNHPILDDREHKVDAIITKAANELRNKLPVEFYTNPTKFRAEVESSELFKLMKTIPKGSTHHIHFDAFGSHTWFVEYMRNNASKYRFDSKNFKFFYYLAPDAKDMEDPSADAGSLTKEAFHAKYNDYFVMTLGEIHESKNIWDSFELKILNRLNIIQPRTAYTAYTKYAFEYAIEFGLQNVQGRIFLHFVKEDDFKDIPLEDEMQLYIDVQTEVQKTHPEFIFSAIVQSLRFWSDEKMKEYLDEAYMLKKKYPKLIIGFDVVAEEDSRKLSDIIGIFVEYKKIIAADGVKQFEFLLHAGESLEAENDNLYDALVFGCPRLGHATNLYRHPFLIEKVKSAKVCIEWSPLSNHLLRYVKDLRCHPHFGIYKTGVKFSISSDDPGVYGTNPGAWDLTTIIITNKFALQDLKGFFLNSIEHCCLDQEQHDTLRNYWFRLWHNFIDSLIQ